MYLSLVVLSFNSFKEGSRIEFLIDAGQLAEEEGMFSALFLALNEEVCPPDTTGKVKLHFGFRVIFGGFVSFFFRKIF